MFVVSSTVFRKQLVSLLAQNEYKQLETLQTLVVEHLTIEKKITKTILQRWKRLWRKRYCDPILVLSSGQFSSERYEEETKLTRHQMIKKSNTCLRAARNMLKQMKESGFLKIVLISTKPPWNFSRKKTGFFLLSTTDRLSTHSLLTYLACVWLAGFRLLSQQGMSGQGCPAKENKHFDWTRSCDPPHPPGDN